MHHLLFKLYVIITKFFSFINELKPEKSRKCIDNYIHICYVICMFNQIQKKEVMEVSEEVKELEIREDYSLLLEQQEDEDDESMLLDGFSIEFYPEALIDSQERR